MGECSPYAHVRVSRKSLPEVRRLAVLRPQPRGKTSNRPSLAGEESEIILDSLAESLKCPGGPVVGLLAEQGIHEAPDFVPLSLVCCEDAGEEDRLPAVIARRADHLKTSEPVCELRVEIVGLGRCGRCCQPQGGCEEGPPIGLVEVGCKV